MKDSKEENDMGVGNDETTNDNQAFIIFAHHQEVLSAVCHLLQTHKQDYMFTLQHYEVNFLDLMFNFHFVDGLMGKHNTFIDKNLCIIFKLLPHAVLQSFLSRLVIFKFLSFWFIISTNSNFTLAGLGISLTKATSIIFTEVFLKPFNIN